MTALFSRSVASLISFISLTVFASTVRASPVAPICPRDLAPQIDAIVNRPNFARSRFGVMIQTLRTRQTLYSRDADRFFIPASNVKILTTVAALRKLTPSYRIRTSVFGTESPSGWSVRLVGRGDPSVSDRQLNDLAQQLKKRGIGRISNLVVEDSYFGRTVLNPDWAIGDISEIYAAPVNSLIFNENRLGFKLVPQGLGQPLKVEWDESIEGSFWRVENRSNTVDAKTEESIEIGRDLSQPILKVSGQLRMGSTPAPYEVAVPNPNERFLRRFVRSLNQAGITIVRSSVSDQTTRSNGIEVARINSPPLRELIKQANQFSDNLYAEVLLRTLGTQNSSTSTVLEKGIASLIAELNRLGIDKTEVELSDGSGLSRQNWTTPIALVKILLAISQQPEAQYFRDSLSIAGVSGTLQGRFQDSPAKGITRAKTGTLTGATALSGYIDPPNYESIAFSIIINQASDVAPVQRSAIDEIVGLLARLRSC
ncbi:D-alanyl-D-alanine carboxypeptidase/D-alanyl-D-alanine endopeptidase [Leptolyngbya sp. NIES-2104]|uniref:D-alanyl-D-alanine carboxypeptidase/D-alanyl-D-alanine endopeptidase n=1 Tax=Leptolyngbya sp. NIES-2104 TaxID=1552121 RepID=UPI0006EC4CE8|nr:D-alanyl-D-alanine carboxypeptidase/D-alanyl-D-alanine-endopeptidase [Leptolyngbya sp. NIES-2104]GAP95913.1 D-alanyl-D-alanine carboxypeptidase [Leptolyngbya sp. NIES-2104]